MCIKQTQSYEYKGVLYVTEIAAVQAGLMQMANDLMKNWSSQLDAGLVKNADEIIYLLEKRKEIDQRARDAQAQKEADEARIAATENAIMDTIGWQTGTRAVSEA